MSDNISRALAGRDLAALALNSSGEYDVDSSYMALEEYENGLVDALTNLLHFACRYEIDFGESLRIARGHYGIESIHTNA